MNDKKILYMVCHIILLKKMMNLANYRKDSIKDKLYKFS